MPGITIKHQTILSPDLECVPVLDAGTAVNVFPESTCGQYIIKGYVEQQVSGGNSTNVTLSIDNGMLQDCAGSRFPAATASGTVPNRCL